MCWVPTVSFTTFSNTNISQNVLRQILKCVLILIKHFKTFD